MPLHKAAAAILCVMTVTLSITAAHATPRHATFQCDNNGRCVSFSSSHEFSAKRHSESRRLGSGSLDGCPISLGCGCNSAVKFLGMSAAEAKRRGLYAARLWAREGAAARKGCVGCFAILSRGRRGGHVGKVVGYDANGNPEIESYANGRLGWTTTVYPAARVIAYRSI